MPIFCLAVIGCREVPSAVKAGDIVTLSFKMTGPEGMRLDESSLEPDLIPGPRDQQFSFRAGSGEVIPGWDSVIIGCVPNREYEFTIPAEKAYGASAVYHDIPPNSPVKLRFYITGIR